MNDSGAVPSNSANVTGSDAHVNQIGSIGTANFNSSSSDHQRRSRVAVGLPSIPAWSADRHGLLEDDIADFAGGVSWRSLHGLHGYGKTTVVAAFAHRVVREAAADVVWLDCSSTTAIAEALRQVARHGTMDQQQGAAAWVDDATPEVLHVWFQRWVTDAPRPLLVVADGWNETSIDVRALFTQAAPSQPVRIIATTTSTAVAMSVDPTPTVVGALSPEQAFEALASAQSGGREDQPGILSALSRQLDFVALGIGLAAGWARSHRHDSYQTLIDAFDETPAWVTSLEVGGYKRSIGSLWDVIAPGLKRRTRDALDELAYLQTAALNLTNLGYTDTALLDELEASTACLITYDGADIVGAVHQLVATVIRAQHSPGVRDQILTRILERSNVLLGADGADHHRWPAARAIDPWIETLAIPTQVSPWRDDWVRAHYRILEYHIGGVQSPTRAGHLIERVESLTAALGCDDPETLATRSNIASWAGQTGHVDTARQLFDDLLKDQTRVLSPDHPQTLTTRSNIASWAGQAGDVGTARQLFDDLLKDQTRVLGPDHPQTLTTRGDIASWAGHAGDVDTARQLFDDLLKDQTRVLGPDHPQTLITRHNVAGWIGESGDHATARQLCVELLRDQRRILGPDHPQTLITRHNVAGWTGESGDVPTALQLFNDLLKDQRRILGPDHPQTLMASHGIAFWAGRAGDLASARHLFDDLLKNRKRILGPDHPHTLATRRDVAYWAGQGEEVATARQLFDDLLKDQRRILGPDHPGTLMTRRDIAYWARQAGDTDAALRLYHDVLNDQDQILGPDHPQTLTTRRDIAYWARQTGDVETSRQNCEDLLNDHQRVLGPNHPHTLTMRRDIAYWAGMAGDTDAALRLYHDLLNDQIQILGPNHTQTLTTRRDIAYWTGQAGDLPTSHQLYQDLFNDQGQVLGPDHPQTLMTGRHIAHHTGHPPTA